MDMSDSNALKNYARRVLIKKSVVTDRNFK